MEYGLPAHPPAAPAAAHPAEAIVPLDDASQADEWAREAPVPRAAAAVAAALAAEPPAAYYARPGGGAALAAAEVAAYRQRHGIQIHHCAAPRCPAGGGFAGVAFVVDVDGAELAALDAACCAVPEAAQAAAAELAAQGESRALTALAGLGLNQYEALALTRVRPGRVLEYERARRGALRRVADAARARGGRALWVPFLAVAPECRGQGLGRRLVGHVCAVADAQRKAVLLEARSERGRDWAKALGMGFEPLERAQRGGEGSAAPPVFLLAREPRPAERRREE